MREEEEEEQVYAPIVAVQTNKVRRHELKLEAANLTFYLCIL